LAAGKLFQTSLMFAIYLLAG